MLSCLSFALLLSSLNLTSIHIPTFNESFLGARAFNMTCTDIAFGPSGAEWDTVASVATSTSGGSLHCTANLTAYAYSGLVYADVVVDSSNVVLSSVRTPANEPWTSCSGNYSVDSCAINAAVTDLHADPPSRLIDMILEQVRSSVNANIQAYVCDVLVPQVQRVMGMTTLPIPQDRNSSHDKRVYPLYNAPLVVAAATAFNGAFAPASSSETPRMAAKVLSETVLLEFGLPDHHIHFARSLVSTGEEERAVDWLQNLVDYVLGSVAPDPFPLLGLPGRVDNLTLDFDSPHGGAEYDSGFVMVDATMASCDDNACEVYLKPGVEITGVIFSVEDSVARMVWYSLIPRLLPLVNAKIAALLHGVAAQQQRDVDDPNATVRVTFGNKAVLREMPKVWPLVLIALVAFVGGGAMVRRNLNNHAAHPILSSATSAPVSATRLVCEDLVMLAVATVSLLLFAASNTMTGASVLVGETLNTYSFSMWNTVTDMWSAGLIPLSICVFIFSGVYPYVKLLSLIYFTVWAQRPLSKRLALIDVLGKFSLIDTFALMVMVSGLEIRNIAHVVIHSAFYYFLLATVLSLALGNFATTLYRRGTSHRVPAEEALADGAAYERVAAADESHGDDTSVPPPSAAASADAPPAPPLSSSPLSVMWRHSVAHASVLPFLLVHWCCLPAWGLGCLEYTIGGLARVLTPTHKTLSLWQLSHLGKRGDSQDRDVMANSIFVVALFTILIAPCLFALMPRRGAFLASWCAVDVFVVACVAGLLQLHQFVTFVLGEGMDDVYTAHATLRWPMLPLAVGSVIVWGLIAHVIFGVRWPAKRETHAPAAI